MIRWMALLMLVVILSCRDEKKSLAGEDTVDAATFMEAFPELSLPRSYYDTGLNRYGDSTVISRKVFTQFIPDSVISSMMPGGQLSIRPVGSIRKTDETYLLARLSEGKKQMLGAFVFDKDFRFLAAKDVLHNRYNDDYGHSVNISREPTFIIAKEKTNNKNQLFYTRTGYAFNKEIGFMVIVNDSNEDKDRQDSIINPIDTFPANNKFSGDYVKDKRNFISLRDGRNASTYLFFVHFEKSNNCNGELKGELVMRDETNGQYTASGDPCVINFKLSANRITVKEEGSCGNHRGIQCFFDDSYNRKKAPKPSKRKR